MAANRFDQPYRPIKFRDAQSTYVPEEYINTNVNPAYVPMPLEGIEKQYTGLQTKFDKSQENIAATNAKIKDFGLQSLNLYGQDFAINHATKVAARNDDYRMAIKDLSARVQSGDINALNEIDNLAANYVNDSYLDYARKVEEQDKKYTEEFEKGKLGEATNHRANQIYLQRMGVINDPNNEAAYGPNAAIDPEVDRFERINKIFDDVKASGSANAQQLFRVTKSDLGFLKTSEEHVDPSDIGRAFELGVYRDPQLRNDIMQEGLAFAYKASLQDPKHLKENIKDPMIVFDDKGEVDIYATANNYNDNTLAGLKETQQLNRGYTKTDQSITHHDWFYDQNKAGADAKVNELKAPVVMTPGADSPINKSLVNKNGNIDPVVAKTTIDDNRKKIKGLEDELSKTTDPAVRNSKEFELNSLKSQTDYLAKTYTAAVSKTPANEIADNFISTMKESLDDNIGFAEFNEYEFRGNMKSHVLDYLKRFNEADKSGLDKDKVAIVEFALNKLSEATTIESYAQAVKEIGAMADLTPYDETKTGVDIMWTIGKWIHPAVGAVSSVLMGDPAVRETYVTPEVAKGEDFFGALAAMSNSVRDASQPYQTIEFANARNNTIITLPETTTAKATTLGKIIDATLSSVNKGAWHDVDDPSGTRINDLISKGYELVKEESSLFISNDHRHAGNYLVFKKGTGEDAVKETVVAMPTNSEAYALQVGNELASGQHNMSDSDRSVETNGKYIVASATYGSQFDDVIPTYQTKEIFTPGKETPVMTIKPVKALNGSKEPGFEILVGGIQLHTNPSDPNSAFIFTKEEAVIRAQKIQEIMDNKELMDKIAGKK